MDVSRIKNVVSKGGMKNKKDLIIKKGKKVKEAINIFIIFVRIFSSAVFLIHLILDSRQSKISSRFISFTFDIFREDRICD